MSTAVSRWSGLAAADLTTWRARAADWAPATFALLAALACSTALADSFELAKVLVLKLGVALALLALASGAAFDLRLLRAPAALAALFFFGLSLLATIFSVEPSTAFYGNYGHDQGLLTQIAEGGWFLAAAALVRSEVAFTRLARGIALVAGLIGIYAIAQHFGIDPLELPPQVEDGRRTFGTVGHPNTVGELLVLAIPLTVWLAWRGRGLGRDLPLWALLAELIALWLTGARGAWGTTALQALALGPLLLLARWSLGRRLAWPLAVAVPLGAVAGTLGLLFVSNISVQADLASSQGGFRGSPLQTRQFLWQAALEMVRERPLLGWGPDTFALVYPGYRQTGLDAWDGSVGRDDAIHNLYLGVAVNAGLLGLATFLSFQVTILLTLLRSVLGSQVREGPPRSTALALLLVWASYLVLYIVGEHRVAVDWLSWALGGAVVGLWTVTARPRKSSLPIRAAFGVTAVLVLVDLFSTLGADLSFKSAVNQRDNGAYREARAAFEWATHLRPMEPVYQQAMAVDLLRLARQTRQTADYRAALDGFTRAAALQQYREPYTVAQLATATEEWEVASDQRSDAPLDIARRAINLDPENPLLYDVAADLASRRGQPTLAHQYWEAARDRSRSPDAYERLGNVALLLHDPSSAREAFREAARRQWRTEFQAALYAEWGDAAVADGQPAEAVIAYSESLAREANDLDIRVKRAEALVAAGQRGDALAEARRVLDERPNDRRASAIVNSLGQP